MLPISAERVKAKMRAVLPIDDVLEVSFPVYWEQKPAGEAHDDLIGVMFDSVPNVVSVYKATVLLLQSRGTHFERIGMVSWNIWGREDTIVRDQLTKEPRCGYDKLKNPVHFAWERRGDVVIA